MGGESDISGDVLGDVSGGCEPGHVHRGALSGPPDRTRPGRPQRGWRSPPTPGRIPWGESAPGHRKAPRPPARGGTGDGALSLFLKARFAAGRLSRCRATDRAQPDFVGPPRVRPLNTGAPFGSLAAPGCRTEIHGNPTRPKSRPKAMNLGRRRAGRRPRPRCAGEQAEGRDQGARGTARPATTKPAGRHRPRGAPPTAAPAGRRPQSRGAGNCATRHDETGRSLPTPRGSPHRADPHPGTPTHGGTAPDREAEGRRPKATAPPPG